MLLGWFVAGYGYAQIRGGAETARFEPGDRILYQEDLSGTPIGEQVEGWEILQGSYEVAEFQDRRWFRPLAYNTHILRRVDFPQDFSVEFTVYLFEPGNAELRVFLHTEEEVRRGPGPDGPAQIYLTVARYGNRDGFWLRAWNPDNRRLQDVARDERRLQPDTVHHVSLQVRGGRLNLFIDGLPSGCAAPRHQLPLPEPRWPRTALQGPPGALGRSPHRWLQPSRRARHRRRLSLLDVPWRAGKPAPAPGGAEPDH